MRSIASSASGYFLADCDGRCFRYAFFSPPALGKYFALRKNLRGYPDLTDGNRLLSGRKQRPIAAKP